jgi:predicted nucleotidyltransferase
MFDHQLRPLSPKSAQQLVQDNLLVKHLAGSHAYGTSLPSSDVDYRGVFVADPVNVRTPFFRVDEVEVTSEEDTKLYELSNFMKLAVDCNPNVVETLWVDMKDVVVVHPAYMLLRQNAPKLLNRKIAFTTSGYALAQLKRIRGHNKWLNNPQPKEKPQPVDFVSMVQHFAKDGEMPRMPHNFSLRGFFGGWRLIPYGKDTFGVHMAEGYSLFNEQTGNLNDDFVEESRAGLGLPVFIVKFNKQEYNDAKVRWEQYWEWKNNRNEKRSVLEEQFGYDTKHAMHLVRLLRMGYEAVTEGVLCVRRPDADELLAVRNGAWTYEEVVAYAEMMDAKVMAAVETSPLPKKPDTKLAAQLVMEVQDMIWNGQPPRNPANVWRYGT